MYKARFGLVYSIHDLAGTGIAEHIRNNVKESEMLDPKGQHVVEAYNLAGLDSILIGFDKDVIEFEFLDKVMDVEAYIVLSRHKSEAGRKSLTVHHTGNPTSRADHGGKPKTLSIAFPALSKKLLTTLNKEAERNDLTNEYSVTLEATHHGPTDLSKPLVFIEIGSTEPEWKDERAREVIAKTVIESISNPPSKEYCIPAVGYGGGHYPVKHTKLHLESEYCYGHIFAKYVFTQEEIGRDVIIQSIEKNYPEKARIAIIEKKSLKSQTRKSLVSILESISVEYILI